MITNIAEFNAKRTDLSYPPIPEGVTEFQKDYGYEVPTAVHGWDWSTTFGRWSALVTFANGWHGWTFPKRPSVATGVDCSQGDN